MSQVAIENLLKNEMGLDTPSIGSAAIARAVQRRMTESGAPGMDAYWQQLNASKEEVQELIEAVVVPETSFFRHAESFEALHRLVTNRWLPTHPNSRLRILSVPCSTGEEPYSIVMTLLMAGVANLDFEVEAIDISNNALTLARRGIYGKNSFRSGDLRFRDRFFTRTDSGYQINGNVKDKVRFKQTNVLHLDTIANRARYDIIFCRNLLIYFDRPSQIHILTILKQLLASGGTMFVGPAEALLMRTVNFSPTNDAMAFAFHEDKHPAKAALPARQSPPALKPAAPGLQSPKPVAYVAPKPPPAPEPPSGQTLEKAKAMADSGNMEEAIRICREHLQHHGDNAEAHYLLGLVHDARGDETRAAEGYRKAVYLNPNHREALIHLALLAERRGDATGAKRLHERARRAGESSR